MYVLVHSSSTSPFIYQYNGVWDFLITQNEEKDGESRICGRGEKIYVLIKYKSSCGRDTVNKGHQ